MSRRLQRSRCYVCGQLLSHFVVSVTQYSFFQGWHKVLPLCKPCAAALFDILREVRAEYQ